MIHEDLPFRVIRVNSQDEVIARANNLLVGRAAYETAVRLYPRDLIHYRDGRGSLRGAIAIDSMRITPSGGLPRSRTRAVLRLPLQWKLAAVAAGAPDALLDSYEEERRPIAASMLGLATKLLDAAKRGEMRRGRKVHQLDLGYAQSPLALEKPERSGGLLGGHRAPDAPFRCSYGKPPHLFRLSNAP